MLEPGMEGDSVATFGSLRRTERTHSFRFSLLDSAESVTPPQDGEETSGALAVERPGLPWDLVHHEPLSRSRQGKRALKRSPRLKCLKGGRVEVASGENGAATYWTRGVELSALPTKAPRAEL